MNIDHILNSSRQNHGPLSVLELSLSTCIHLAFHHPPPSSVPDNNAIAALQTASDTLSAPHRPLGSREVAALQFSASTKVGHHHSDPLTPIRLLSDAISPTSKVQQAVL
jgi:hypothetical protein